MDNGSLAGRRRAPERLLLFECGVRRSLRGGDGRRSRKIPGDLHGMPIEQEQIDLMPRMLATQLEKQNSGVAGDNEENSRADRRMLITSGHVGHVALERSRHTVLFRFKQQGCDIQMCRQRLL